MILLAILQIGLQFLCSPNTQPADVKVLPESVGASVAFSATRSPLGVPTPEGDLIIAGEFRYAFPVLAAKKVTFKRGSHLILDIPSDRGGYSVHFTLIASSVEVEDPENPGAITWDPGIAPGVPQSSLEQASSGAPGRENGRSGAPGNSGIDGASGVPGKSGPSIILLVREARHFPDIVICGQPGGRGGTGQPGGQGGRGGQGESASQSAFNCSRGAGNGGPGGNGGNGGRGGRGGQGGDGGSVILIMPRLSTKALMGFRESGSLRAFVAGGKGGAGGSGAPGGAGGDSGAPGAEQLPWCRGSGSPGPNGTRGVDGVDGTVGEDGQPGTASLGFMDSKLLYYLFKDVR